MTVESHKPFDKEFVENRASFMDRVSNWSEVNRYRLIFSYNLPKYAHKDQLRDDGTRYFEHPRAVALIAMDELGLGEEDHEVIELCLGHDVFEDQYVLDNSTLGTYEENKKIATFIIGRVLGDKVARGFIAISKLKGKDVDSLPKDVLEHMYHDNLWAADPETIVAKGCDRLHNVRTLGTTTPEKQARKIAETKEIYLPLFKEKLKGTKYESSGDYIIEQIKKEIEKLESN